MRRNLFLFLLWEKSRKLEDEIRSRISHEFDILREIEVLWPRKVYLRRLWDFYGFGSWFTWWNKSRKCGRGSFLVLVVEDHNPVWAKRRDTRGRELVVDDHVYQLKRELRQMTGHSNIIHSSVTLDETLQEMQALFHCTPEEVVAVGGIPSADELEKMFAEGRMTAMGEGRRRICWRIPGTDLCLKSYRNDEEIFRNGASGLKNSIVREIKRCRHDERCNTSCLEWRYHQELQATLPEDLLKVFPERMERVHLPTRGWCVVETVLANYDGTPVRSVVEEMVRFGTVGTPTADIVKFRALRRELRRLLRALASAAVRFYDPPNVLVQWTSPDTFRLRIADFEPKSRTAIALDRWFDCFARLKCRRRYGRFLRTLGLKPQW